MIPHTVSSLFRKAVTRRFLAVALLMLAVPLSATRVQAQATTSAARSPEATAGEKTTPEGQVSEKNEEEKENDAYRHSPMVEHLGAAVGMKPEMATTAFTLINLLILVVVVAYFLIKSLPKAFRNRNTAIQKNLVDARTATEEASSRLNSVEDRLSKLDAQIVAMREQSEKDSVRDEQRIKANLEDEKAKIMAAAEQEIHSATVTAQRNIQQYAAELAIEQAARKLVVTAETDRLLIESFAHRLGGDKGGQN